MYHVLFLVYFGVTTRAPGGPYEKKAAKLFAKGMRSLECCKNEQKRIKKMAFARPGAHFCPWVYFSSIILLCSSLYFNCFCSLGFQ